MMAKKDETPQHNNAITDSGLNGKTITGVDVYRLGSMSVFEFAFSGGSAFFKVRQNQVEMGGTVEWGTGTRVIG